ncbi:hypothetical protein [Massilia sp. DWR3-1-1]|uniref:FimV/HubP-related protein n=1 Tax=Massilia sp. DWR3-1-1 TaxID=2804559 RepID=UPI003CE6AC4E
MHFRYCCLVAALCAALPVLADAVELGDAHLRSHIGQPLSADIELLGAASDSVPIQAGLADAEVYRGANIAMHPALAGANITTFRRDGRRYLHISSSMPVKGDHLPIFFSLGENGQKSVRQLTLWLTPDPNPAPPPPPPPPPVLVPPAPLPLPAVAPVVPPPPVAVAHLQAQAPHVPKVVMPKVVAALPFVPLPAAAPHRQTLQRAAPACGPRVASADAGVCAALDAKNAALNAHLAELEDKVKHLSAALQGGAASAVAAHAASATAGHEAPAAAGHEASAAASAAHEAPAPVVKPAPKPLPPKLVPMGSAPPEPSAGRPWLVIGIVAAIILSLVAGLGVMMLRQRKKAASKRKTDDPVTAAAADPVPPKPSLIASVKNRLMPGRAAPAAAPVEEAPVANTVPAH